MSNDFKLGITGAIEPNITFLGGASKEVLRLSKDGIWANPDIPADDAAKLVLAAIDHNIKVMVDKAVNDKLEGAANYIDALGGDSKKYRQTLAQPEQEPVQFKCTVIDDAHPNGIPLEQWAKPQRTWVGLSDEEIWEAISRIGTSDSDVNPYAILKDARAIEAKLKDKNK